MGGMGSAPRYTGRLYSELRKVLYRIGLVPMGSIRRHKGIHDDSSSMGGFLRVLRGGNVGTAVEQALKDSVGTSYNRLEEGDRK